MSAILASLLKDKSRTEGKSYLVGLERGRIWASESADYFELREWSEADFEEFDDLTLPHDESREFCLMQQESDMDWRSYLKGWLEGVRETRSRD